MTYPFTISESERQSILNLYGLESDPSVLRERINSFRFTSDMKYVVYENRFYSTETGELMPLLEKWTLSDILHTIGDAASMGMDFIIPGSGAIVDIINGTSYFIEAAFQKDPKKRNHLLIMGAITFAFVVIPGPLQSVAVPMKRFVKYGASKAIALPVLKGLEIVYKNLSKIVTALPKLIQRALESNLGKKVLGKFGKNLASRIGKMTKGIEEAYIDVIKRARQSVDPDRVLTKSEKEAKAAKKLGKKQNKGILKAPSRMVRRGAKILSVFGFKKLDNFITGNVAAKLSGELSAKLLRKLGFSKNWTYRYVSQTASKGKAWAVLREVKILDTKAGGVLLKDMKNGQEFFVSNAHFINQAVAAPWIRRGKGRYVPFFIKRLSDFLLPDGMVNEEYLDQLPDLSPSQTSMESLAYLRDEVSNTQPNQQTMGVTTGDPGVQAVQNALILLGYSVGNTGADGKFGPATQSALRQFQIDNRLEDTNGQINRLTARELAAELRNKNLDPRLRAVLNSI